MENKLLEPQKSKDINEIIQHGYKTDAAGYISQAFEIFKSNALNYILYTLLYLVVTSLFSRYYAIQFLASILLAPLAFGAFIVANKIIKKQSYEFKDFFSGYDRFLDIMIYFLIQIVVIIFMVLPVVAISYFTFVAIFGASSLQNLNGTTLIFLVLFALFIFVVTIILSTLLMFAPTLFWFKKMRAIDALMNSAKIIKIKFPNWIGFFFMIFGINILGALALGVGLLVSMPVSMIAVYIAYERVVGTETMIED
jgi:hypothetical protein